MRDWWLYLFPACLLVAGAFVTWSALATLGPRQEAKPEVAARGMGIKITDLFADCAVTVDGNPAVFTITAPRLGTIRCSK